MSRLDSLQNIHVELEDLNAEVAQLKATGRQVGLLVNFKNPKAQIKRLVPWIYPKGMTDNARPCRPGISLRLSA